MNKHEFSDIVDALFAIVLLVRLAWIFLLCICDFIPSKTISIEHRIDLVIIFIIGFCLLNTA